MACSDGDPWRIRATLAVELRQTSRDAPSAVAHDDGSVTGATAAEVSEPRSAKRMCDCADTNGLPPKKTRDVGANIAGGGGGMTNDDPGTPLSVLAQH